MAQREHRALVTIERAIEHVGMTGGDGVERRVEVRAVGKVALAFDHEHLKVGLRERDRALESIEHRRRDRRPSRDEGHDQCVGAFVPAAHVGRFELDRRRFQLSASTGSATP